MTHGTCTSCTLCYSGTSGIMKGQGTDNRYVCHNQVLPYKVSFPYIIFTIIVLGLGMLFIIPRTLLYEGSLKQGSTVL